MGWTSSTEIFKSGKHGEYYPYNRKGTIGHYSYQKNTIISSNTNGINQYKSLEGKFGQNWGKQNGQVRMKRENGKLSWIFDKDENATSTIVLEAEEYGLDERQLKPLIYLPLPGVKILIKNIVLT